MNERHRTGMLNRSDREPGGLRQILQILVVFSGTSSSRFCRTSFCGQRSLLFAICFCSMEFSHKKQCRAFASCGTVSGSAAVSDVTSSLVLGISSPHKSPRDIINCMQTSHQRKLFQYLGTRCTNFSIMLLARTIMA